MAKELKLAVGARYVSTALSSEVYRMLNDCVVDHRPGLLHNLHHLPVSLDHHRPQTRPTCASSRYHCGLGIGPFEES